MSWLKWLAKVAGSAIVVSLITLVMTWYVVSLVVTNIFQQLQLPANLIPQIQFTDVIAGVFNKPEADKSKTTELTPLQSEKPREDRTIPKGSIEVSTSPPPGSGEATEVWKQDQDVVMSRDAFTKLKDNISVEDKIKIFNIISTKLPEEDVQKISKLLENGITSDGLEQIQTILQNRLNGQEYQELLTILTNNGG